MEDGVERGGLGAEVELYGLFGVEVFRFEEELSFLFGAAQELLGEGWPVIGPVGLGTH